MRFNTLPLTMRHQYHCVMPIAHPKRVPDAAEVAALDPQHVASILHALGMFEE